MTNHASPVCEANSDMAAFANPATAQDSADIGVALRPSCFLCGNTGTELYRDTVDWLFDAPGKWGLRHCGPCGVLWLDPQPNVEDIPKLYTRYYTHHGPSEPLSFKGLRRETLEYVLARLGYRVQPSNKLLPRLLSHFRPIARAHAMDVLNLASEAGTLLDVGCGNGYFISKMRSLGWTVSGVDPDHSAVAYGRSMGLQVFEGSISDVPGDERYDVITLSHVIEHVADPIGLLQQCRRRLRPRTGRIVLTTPNINSLGHRWFKRFWRGLEVPRHLVLFSPQALSRCLSQAGMRLQSSSTETRIAVRIHNASVCARQGHRNVAERTSFSFSTKIAGYFFMALENVLIYFDKDLGEELFCVCTADSIPVP
jgi:2-polyprenyl-3-methyl-5-hydroxy-6-metoxy-1,4-benzoquinol methylase